MDSVKEGNVEIEYAHIIQDPPPTTAATNKVFLLSGEHARELIGAETNLRFLEKLCGGADAEAGVSLAGVKSRVSAADVLKDAEFKVVLNGNPLSRIKVEGDDYCKWLRPTCRLPNLAK